MSCQGYVQKRVQYSRNIDYPILILILILKQSIIIENIKHAKTTPTKHPQHQS